MNEINRKTTIIPVDKLHGKGRPRTTRTGQVYTDPNDRLYEADIREKFIERCGDDMRYFDGPVTIEIVFTRPLPKSRPKRENGSPDLRKPDTDNLVKTVFDALNGVAWRDDAQIVKLIASKGDLYHGAPTTIYLDIIYLEV